MKKAANYILGFSPDYLQIVRPLAKTGDDHIEETTEYNEVSTEYNEVITEQESTEYNGLSTPNNEENTKQSLNPI